MPSLPFDDLLTTNGSSLYPIHLSIYVRVYEITRRWRFGDVQFVASELLPEAGLQLIVGCVSGNVMGG